MSDLTPKLVDLGAMSRIISLRCRCGGIGRRSGFKIRRLIGVSVRVRPPAPSLAVSPVVARVASLDGFPKG